MSPSDKVTQASYEEDQRSLGEGDAEEGEGEEVEREVEVKEKEPLGYKNSLEGYDSNDELLATIAKV